MPQFSNFPTKNVFCEVWDHREGVRSQFQEATPLSVCERSLANAAAARNLARIFHGKKLVECPFNVPSSDFRCDIDSGKPLHFPLKFAPSFLVSTLVRAQHNALQRTPYSQRFLQDLMATTPAVSTVEVRTPHDLFYSPAFLQMDLWTRKTLTPLMHAGQFFAT